MAKMQDLERRLHYTVHNLTKLLSRNIRQLHAAPLISSRDIMFMFAEEVFPSFKMLVAYEVTSGPLVDAGSAVLQGEGTFKSCVNRT